MIDVACMSLRLGDKQLTVRLMSIPGKASGEFTVFDSPYMANGRILNIDECAVENSSSESAASQPDVEDEMFITTLRSL